MFWVRYGRVNSALPVFYPFSSLEAQFQPLCILRDYFLNQNDYLISDVNFLHFYFVYNKSIFIIKKSQTRPEHLKKAVVLRDYCLISHKRGRILVQCPFMHLCPNYARGSLCWSPLSITFLCLDVFVPMICPVLCGSFKCMPNGVYKGLHTACTFNVKCNKYTSKFLLTGYVGLKCNRVPLRLLQVRVPFGRGYYEGTLQLLHTQYLRSQ